MGTQRDECLAQSAMAPATIAATATIARPSRSASAPAATAMIRSGPPQQARWRRKARPGFGCRRCIVIYSTVEPIVYSRVEVLLISDDVPGRDMP